MKLLNQQDSRSGVSRRALLRSAAALGGAALLRPAAAFPMIHRRRYALFPGAAGEYSARAAAIIGRATVIDMLSPLVLSQSKTLQWLNHPASATPAEIQRYKDSRISVFHNSIGIGGPDAYLECVKFFGGWNGFLAQHSDDFLRITQPADLDRVKSTGKAGVLLGLQDSDHFTKPDDVDYFHGLGQRVSQLTYNSRNLIGNGSTERRDEGISDFGVSIVERMNKVGMAVDVSHCGDRTTLDAFELSKKPVLVTHSNCRALTPAHPRCKTDEAIQKLGKSGGVMGITGVRMFVRDKEPTTIEHVLDHFDHVAKLIGVEHVGIGSDVDLDGYDKMPPDELKQLRAGYKGSYGFRDKVDIEGLDHPKRMFDLTEGLIRRGYSDADIEGILGGNFKRVLKEIWTV